VAESNPTVERLRECLNYDPVSGIFTWKISTGSRGRAGVVAGTVNKKGRVSISVDGARFLGHRLAFAIYYGRWPQGQIDHKFGQEAGNGIANLREVTNRTNSENQRSARRSNKLGVQGVCIDNNFKSRTKYRANLKIDGRQTHLGSFDTAEEAHAAYVIAKRKFHEGCTI
jgi:hypothetical protein